MTSSITKPWKTAKRFFTAVLIILQINICPFFLSASMADSKFTIDNKEPGSNSLGSFVIKNDVNLETGYAVDEILFSSLKKEIKHQWTFKPLSPLVWGKRSNKELAITFDDGLDANAAQRVLKILKDNDVRCTFFIIGSALKQHPDLWKQAIQDGHQICNHTRNHTFFQGLSEKQIKDEIKGWEEDAESVFGKEYLENLKKDYPFLRLPGGSGGDSKRISEIISGQKYISIGWSDETVYSVLRNYDLQRSDVHVISAQIRQHIAGNAENGSIILLHFNDYDADRLDDIIKDIKNKGYQLKRVSDIIEQEKL